MENNWESQQEEIESLTYIYPEELTVLKEQPYSFEVMINSNTESDDRNYLKMKIIFDLQNSYPDVVPFFRLKNLSPDYMDNKFIDRLETALQERGKECLGSMMIFELCDLVKEKITNINEEVLEKVDMIHAESSVDASLKTQQVNEHMSYTPVTKETFGAWCEVYRAELNAIKAARRTVLDDKPTGRQLFEMNKQAFEDLAFEDENEATAAVTQEESKEPEEEEEGDFEYDPALYEGVEEEDVDFD